MNRLFILLLLALLPGMLPASERFIIKFELVQAGKTIEKGSTFVTPRQNVWRKGYKRTYLALNCVKQANNQTEKRITSVDHFAGLLITHQIIGNQIALEVEYSQVTPKLNEIRNLPDNICREIKPDVSKQNLSATVDAKNGIEAQFNTEDGSIFQIKVQSIRQISQ